MSLQAKFEELYQKFSRERNEQPGICRTPACVALQLGHLVRVCSIHKLNPNDNTWNQSLLRIAEIVRDVPDLYLPYSSSYGYHKDHSECSWVPEFQAATNHALNTVEGLKLSSLPTG